MLATLRKKMIALSTEIAEGMAANGSRSHGDFPGQVPMEKRNDKNFFIGDMIPTIYETRLRRRSIARR